jgi:DNA invertase Pin-like site-specific DNA recombinase
MKKVIAYYRVSTNDQNLGISAQKEIVRRYCEFNSADIISEYEEHESGKKNDRPQLTTALAESVKNNAYLIVAKIDRLTRVAYYGLQLCEKYRIIFCDHPDMGTLEQSIYFGMAQQEREYISIRTKNALAVLKAKGVKLGAPNASFSDDMRKMAYRKLRESAINNDANKRAYALVSVMDGNYTDKARHLNRNGFLTSKGNAWSGKQVKRLITIFQESANGDVTAPQ